MRRERSSSSGRASSGTATSGTSTTPCALLGPVPGRTSRLVTLNGPRELFEDILRQTRLTPHELVEAIALSQLADIAVDEGRVADAVSLLKESHRILRELNDLLLIAAGVGRFASVLALAGRAAVAAQVLSSSTVLMEEIGAGPPWFARISTKTLAVIRTQLDETAFAEAGPGPRPDRRRGRRTRSRQPRLSEQVTPLRGFQSRTTDHPLAGSGAAAVRLEA